MITKEEIKEWLEACKAKEEVVGFVVAYWYADHRGAHPLSTGSILYAASWFEQRQHAIPLHLLNPELTAIQGPTFAEWKKQKGREEKLLRIQAVIRDTLLQPCRDRAVKILDAIEGE